METEITLRALEPLDVELLYEWENSPDLWEYSDVPAPFSRYALQQYVERATTEDIYALRQLRLMVDLAQPHGTRATIGAVDLYDLDPLHARAGVGVLIFDKCCRQKGHATQALKQLIDYAFGTLHLHQLHCAVSESNIASLSLFKKLGFEATGLRKAWRKHGDSFENEIFMQRFSQKM
ncbi:MAG: GNAT family N-acetyltransferase [Prevotellaceae bacterium]|jgi:diamine N-acetyltransferase|nr:GNAT family N-acetyltransferase [Prevotellaceae bacterium]